MSSIPFSLTSPAFEQEQQIPYLYTCDGQDKSPKLVISGVPSGAKSLVLIMDDPDAPMGTWDHWVAYNIPPTVTTIEEGTEPPGSLGLNSWNKTGYGGPCPPGGEHRYFFKLYALDTQLEFTSAPTKAEVELQMEDHILEQTELVGHYSRQ